MRKIGNWVMRTLSLVLILLIVFTLLPIGIVPSVTASQGSRLYLENEIKGSGSGFYKIPADGPFEMDGITYFRGIVMRWTNSSDTIKYNLSGRGVTRFTALYGRREGSTGGTLTITGNNGILLANYEYNAGDSAKKIEVDIPLDTREFVIRMQSFSGTRFALADAYFSDGSQQEEPPVTPQPETPPPPPSSIIPNPHSEWATEELEIAADMGIIPESLQDPSIDYAKPISRVEFAGIVVKTYELLANTTALPTINNPFKDTNSADALKAYNTGLMVGVSAAEFDPDTKLTREMAATALTRVFKRATMPGWSFATDADNPLNYTRPSPFNDDANISSWAKDSVYFMAANGIIKGFEGNVFGPRNTTTEEEARGYATATREQALIIAKRMIENLG